MRTSETFEKVAAALVKFNSKVTQISKDAKNPYFKKDYATLDQIVNQIRPILTDNGLSVLQAPNTLENGNVLVKTLILHESGQFLESDGTSLKLAKNDPQGAGAGITYARRYDLCAFLSLNTGDDDDGNGASGKDKQLNEQQTPPPKQVGQAVIKAKFLQGRGTEPQFQEWYAKLVAQGMDNNAIDQLLTKKLMEKNDAQ